MLVKRHVLLHDVPFLLGVSVREKSALNSFCHVSYRRLHSWRSTTHNYTVQAVHEVHYTERSQQLHCDPKGPTYCL